MSTNESTSTPIEPTADESCCPSGDCRLTLEIFTLNNMIMRMGDKLVGHLGLTSSRWLLLGALSRYEEPPTISLLSTDALLSLQNVSRMVAAMEEDGLVRRSTKIGQGRATFVEFTDAGREAVAKTKRIGAAFAEKFHEGLSEEELDTMQSGMQRLFSNLAAMQDDPGAILERTGTIAGEQSTEQE